MRYVQIILLTVFTALFMSACSSDNKKTTIETETNTTKPETNATQPEPEVPVVEAKSKFYESVSAALQQSEDDEPLDITDNIDTNSSFNELL